MILRILQRYALPFMLIGVIYALTEYFIELGSDDRDAFWPLLVRATVASTMLGTSIGIFDQLFKHHFQQRPFLYLVLVKTLCYTLMVSFWLILINGSWEVYSSQRTFSEGMLYYMNQPTYLINLFTVFGIILMFSAMIQINSLHRKGELVSFITGRYHRPIEAERIFAFIDLKGSTSIAEKLGHHRFGLFLKDYYADLTEPIRNTQAEVYQYVGDEIILSWPPSIGHKNQNAIKCILEIQRTITTRKDYYIDQYGYMPQFRTGMHSGKVLITWVGEVKKEILYIGDVMNTTARIQEDCKRLGQEFLISEEIANKLNSKEEVNISFVEQTIPRGKEKSVKLYSVVQS